jgi:hypothetical protein
MRSPYRRASAAISLFAFGLLAGWNLRWGSIEPNAMFVAIALCGAILVGGFVTWSEE